MFLPLKTGLSILIFSGLVACQTENTSVMHIRSDSEKSSLKKETSSDLVIEKLVGSRNLAPANSMNECNQIYKNFKRSPKSPSEWIAVLAVLNLSDSRLPKRKRACASTLKKKLQNIENDIDQIDAKTLFLIKIATGVYLNSKKNETLASKDNIRDESDSKLKNILSFLEAEPEIINGMFFKSSTLAQSVIIKSLFCRSFGQTLLMVKDEVLSNKSFDLSDYVIRCMEREARRSFLSKRVAKLS